MGFKVAKTFDTVGDNLTQGDCIATAWDAMMRDGVVSEYKIPLCPGAGAQIARGPVAVCVCGLSFHVVEGCIPAHQKRPEDL